jgi:hypothetical protein
MLTVADSALAQLANAVGQIDDPKPKNACFRIVPKGDGKLTLTVDVPRPDDTAFDHDEKTVLVTSDEMCERCEGRTLDSDDSGNLLLT